MSRVVYFLQKLNIKKAKVVSVFFLLVSICSLAGCAANEYIPVPDSQTHATFSRNNDWSAVAIYIDPLNCTEPKYLPSSLREGLSGVDSYNIPANKPFTFSMWVADFDGGNNETLTATFIPRPGEHYVAEESLANKAMTMVDLQVFHGAHANIPTRLYKRNFIVAEGDNVDGFTPTGHCTDKISAGVVQFSGANKNA